LNSTRGVVNFLARAIVIGLAAAFLIVWWKPSLLGVISAPADAGPHKPIASAKPTAAVESAAPAPAAVVVASFADAVARATPAVVNIYTARVVTEKTQARRSNNCSAIIGRATGSASSAAWARA
jgi:serine protease DegS